jgi:hypothetical protein
VNLLISAIFALSAAVGFSSGEPNIDSDPAAVPTEQHDIVGFFEPEIAILTFLSPTRKAGWITGFVLCPIAAVKFALQGAWLQASISAILVLPLSLRRRNVQRSCLS